tara:strand:+ start:579 stop:755 length:177 start_codon:yes stop_codon:yes gene_type:complete
LEAYFTINFELMHNHNWSLSDIENMVPWERDIYLIKIEHWIKEENERNKEHQRRQQRG